MARRPLAATRSIGDLTSCAEAHIAAYVSDDGLRAYPTYDTPSDSTTLTALDCLAPNLLSYTFGWRRVIPMFEPTGDSRDLLNAMQAVLDAQGSTDASFLELDLDDPHGLWSVVRKAMTATADVPSVKAVAVSKILHRKRPNLVPLYDRKVYEFYFGHPPRNWHAPGDFWPALQADLVTHRHWLDDVRRAAPTQNGPGLTLLRAADMIVWEHMQNPVATCGR